MIPEEILQIVYKNGPWVTHYHDGGSYRVCYFCREERYPKYPDNKQPHSNDCLWPKIENWVKSQKQEEVP